MWTPAGKARINEGFDAPERCERSVNMPKQKTRKSVVKRVKITAKGKVKRTTAGRGHLLTGKSRKRKRRLRGGSLVSGADRRRILTQIAG